MAAARRMPSSALGQRLAAGREITGGIVTELAHDGDEAARAVLTEVGRRLGYGLVGVVNVFNPEVIVIGGGAIAAGELLLGPAREVVAERALPPARESVRIVPTHFGDESGMLGAALLALDSLAAEGKVQSLGRGRARRWMTPPMPGFTTTLLLPGPYPGS